MSLKKSEPILMADRVPGWSKAVNTGGFGGGWLEHARRWRGAQWAGLFLGVPSCPEPPGVP